jgi:hypothetical protein
MKKVNSDFSQEESEVNHGSRARIDPIRALELLKSLPLPPAPLGRKIAQAAPHEGNTGDTSPPAKLIDALYDAVLEVLPKEEQIRE